MQYRVFGDTYVVRLQRGEEVLACLRELCEKESISLGTVSAIGAVNHVVVGNITEKDGEPYLHLHATFGDLTGKVIGGHLNEAVVSATCELFVRKVEGHVGRRLDPETGLNIFDF